MPDIGSTNLAASRVALIDPATGNLIQGPNSVSRIASAANSVNATVAKATPGRLFRVHGMNAAAAVRYIKFWNKATTPDPANDSALLLLGFALQASVPFSIDLGPYGVPFTTGIGYALMTGAADNNATAVTAADILGLNVIFS